MIAPSWPVAPLHFESSRFLICAVSILIAKMAPSRLGGKCHNVSTSVAKVMKWMRLVAPVAPFPESRRLFWSRKSRNGNSWPRTYGHTKYGSRYIWKFSVAKVCKCLNSVAKILPLVWDIDLGTGKTFKNLLRKCIYFHHFVLVAFSSEKNVCSNFIRSALIFCMIKSVRYKIQDMPQDCLFQTCPYLKTTFISVAIIKTPKQYNHLMYFDEWLQNDCRF